MQSRAQGGNNPGEVNCGGDAEVGRQETEAGEIRTFTEDEEPRLSLLEEPAEGAEQEIEALFWVQASGGEDDGSVRVVEPGVTRSEGVRHGRRRVWKDRIREDENPVARIGQSGGDVVSHPVRYSDDGGRARQENTQHEPGRPTHKRRGCAGARRRAMKDGDHRDVRLVCSNQGSGNGVVLCSQDHVGRLHTEAMAKAKDRVSGSGGPEIDDGEVGRHLDASWTPGVAHEKSHVVPQSQKTAGKVERDPLRSAQWKVGKKESDAQREHGGSELIGCRTRSVVCACRGSRKKWKWSPGVRRRCGGWQD